MSQIVPEESTHSEIEYVQQPCERTSDPDGYQMAVICGSMRFFTLMLDVAREYTRAGFIVLMPFDASYAGNAPGDETKQMLDRMHHAKILRSDLVLVVSDETGYTGESTRSEIAYSERHGKPVEYHRRSTFPPPYPSTVESLDTGAIEKLYIRHSAGNNNE